jgi:hypothetical protein
VDREIQAHPAQNPAEHVVGPGGVSLLRVYGTSCYAHAQEGAQAQVFGEGEGGVKVKPQRDIEAGAAGDLEAEDFAKEIDAEAAPGLDADAAAEAYPVVVPADGGAVDTDTGEIAEGVRDVRRGLREGGGGGREGAEREESQQRAHARWCPAPAETFKQDQRMRR